DGNANDFVIWERPRLAAAGRPDLLLRDVREVSCELVQRRQRIFSSAAVCLAVAAEVDSAQGKIDITELARRHNVDAEALGAWMDFLGTGGRPASELGNIDFALGRIHLGSYGQAHGRAGKYSLTALHQFAA